MSIHADIYSILADKVLSDLIVSSALGTADLSTRDNEDRLRFLNDLFKKLYEQQDIVQEVHIDNRVFREDYNAYLLEHLMEIQSIEIKTVHETVLTEEIKYELRNYLPKFIRACDSISELFYGELNKEDWRHFGQLTEGLQWIGQSTRLLLQYSQREGQSTPLRVTLEGFSSNLESHILELEKLLQNEEYTALGDHIKYEMPDTFNLFLDRLQSEVVS